MANYQCYAVAVGRRCGVYDSWTKCKEAVAGFTGAVWRGFQSRHDAEQWLMVWRAARSKHKDGWTFVPASNRW